MSMEGFSKPEVSSKQILEKRLTEIDAEFVAVGERIRERLGVGHEEKLLPNDETERLEKERREIKAKLSSMQ